MCGGFIRTIAVFLRLAVIVVSERRKHYTLLPYHAKFLQSSSVSTRAFLSQKIKMDKVLLLLLCAVGLVSSIPTNMRRQGRRSQAQSLEGSSDGVRDFLSNARIIFSNERETIENDDENDFFKKINLYVFFPYVTILLCITHASHFSLYHTHTHPI